MTPGELHVARGIGWLLVAGGLLILSYVLGAFGLPDGPRIAMCVLAGLLVLAAAVRVNLGLSLQEKELRRR